MQKWVDGNKKSMPEIGTLHGCKYCAFFAIQKVEISWVSISGIDSFIHSHSNALTITSILPNESNESVSVML